MADSGLLSASLISSRNCTVEGNSIKTSEDGKSDVKDSL